MIEVGVVRTATMQTSTGSSSAPKVSYLAVISSVVAATGGLLFGYDIGEWWWVVLPRAPQSEASDYIDGHCLIYL